jgi:formate-dependent phosphoribosylglycinamide formyltransferase (GAR transformylase)
MGSRPTLLVVYDIGSLGPTRLAEAAQQNDCDLVFLAAATDHVREIFPVLDMVGTVLDMSSLAPDDLLRSLSALRPAGIVTFSENQLATTVRLAESLGLPCHRSADLEAITHKDRQRERLAESGVEQIRFFALTAPEQADEAISHVGLPAIIKPVVGTSSRNTVEVATPDQCRDVLAAVFSRDGTRPAETAVILEEVLVGRPVPAPWGDYMAVNCVATDDDVRPVFATSKFALAHPFRARGGYGGRSIVPDAEFQAVRELACRAVRAVGAHGIADVEIKLTPSGPRVIEVNGRLGAWVDDIAVRSQTSDPAQIAVRAALGRPVEAPVDQKSGPIAFHYLVLPPVTARRVRAIRDVQALRRLPNVDRVSILAEPGARVDWQLGTIGNVAAVTGTTRTHEELAETVSAVEGTDWIDYDC